VDQSQWKQKTKRLAWLVDAQVDRGITIKKGKSSSKINEMRQKEAVPPKKRKIKLKREQL